MRRGDERGGAMLPMYKETLRDISAHPPDLQNSKYVLDPVRSPPDTHPMPHTTLTDFRPNFARHFDRIEADRADVQGLRETLRLRSSRANADHLFASIAQLRAGEAVERRLIETCD